MSSDYALRFSSLDKAGLKADFIDYLKTTSEFKNLNPDASGVASILDLLAYNAYHQSLMANFQYNEIFLDTAVKRSNVVSRAAELGYTPYSKRASKVSLIVTARNIPGNPSSLVLPIGSSFTTTIDNESYTFMTLVPHSATMQIDNQNIPYYNFQVVALEGTITQETFTMNTRGEVKIENIDIDTSTLRVFNHIAGGEVELFQASNFLTTEEDNKVFFIDEGFNSFNVSFGDGVFGYKPIINSSIRLSYIITAGRGANGASQFAFASIIPGATIASVSVAAISASAGGADEEDIESIKVNAKGRFSSQDRAVTPGDYKAIIMQTSTNIKDAIVWGGETNSPPIFGKVIACVQPRFGDVLPKEDKDNINTVLKTKSVTDIELIFRDPKYLNIIVNTTAIYDSKVITSSVYDLTTLIQSTIANYVNSNLSKFNGRLRFSNLSSAIDRADSSILNNSTSIMLKKKYTPVLYTKNSIEFSFNNSLVSTNQSYAMKSTFFYVSDQTSSVWIEDTASGHIKSGSGHLHLFYFKNGVKTYAAYNIGYLNYATGLVTIEGLTITGIDGTTLDFIASPLDLNISSINDTIIKVDSSDIKVLTAVNK